MKVIDGINHHTLELSEPAILTIRQLAMMAMAPYQKLLNDIGGQLPKDPEQPKETS